MKDLLKAFIIGSCWFSFVIFFLGFYGMQSGVNKNNCSSFLYGNTYMLYTVMAPLYIGLMSSLAIAMRNYLKISTREAFVVTGIISATIVYVFISLCSVYKADPGDFKYLRLLIYHFFLYSGIIATLYLYLDS
jgi:hypothetical protein